MIGGYSKIYALGHRAVRELFSAPVRVEEKVDGSQFSFGVIDGAIMARSRNRALDMDAPDQMFSLGVQSVEQLAHKLLPNAVYRGEYLNKPKHNVNAYDRVPEFNIAIWDIEKQIGSQDYMTPDERATECDRLGLEPVPTLYEGMVEDRAMFDELLETVSFLGGQKIEGVVIKSPTLLDVDKKMLCAKFVSPVFREVHSKEWKKTANKDIVSQLADKYRTPARWAKAVQHLKEAGTLTNTPKDIAPLLRECSQDVEEECGEAIREALYKWCRKPLLRSVTRGLPEWYKEELLNAAFVQPQSEE